MDTGSRRNGKREARGQQKIEDWEDYFSSKKAKLDEQLNTTSLEPSCPQIFTGVSIYINGYTNPPEPELRSIFSRYGGQYTPYLDSRTTFIVATNLPLAKKKLMWNKTLKPEWIIDSVKAGVKLEHRPYFLYNVNEETNQRTLSQAVEKQKRSANLEMETKRLPFKLTTCSSSPSKSDLASESETEPVALETEGPEYTIEGDSPVLSEEPLRAQSVLSTRTRNRVLEDSVQEDDKASPIKINIFSRTSNDGYLDDFYKNSRLHLISTTKTEMQLYVAELRKNAAAHGFPLRTEYEAMAKNNESGEFCTGSREQVVFHVDLDCFFVAVCRLSRPHLIDVPVVVTHSTGTGKIGSKSDIACASYEARSFGISAGMWLEEAQALCPNLRTTPYDFDEIKQVSKMFFSTVASLSLEIEPISCDELYLNATKILEKRGSKSSLAEFLRKSIEEKCKIRASIGIGSNKLSARIASRLAKDNGEGQRAITVAELKAYLKDLPVEKLPGVGPSMAKKIQDSLKAETCGEVEKFSLEKLKEVLLKSGEKLFNFVRGIDTDTVNCEYVPAKSIGAGCSFGVRFASAQQMDKFIQDVSNEVSKRAAHARCYANKLTLALWVVSPERLNDPVKPGGHGAADVHTRTTTKFVRTREARLIYETSRSLAKSITQEYIRVRGVRITLEQLKYEDEISEKERRTVQSTLLSVLTVGGKSRRTKSSSSLSPAASPKKGKLKQTPSSPSTAGSSKPSGLFKFFKPISPNKATPSRLDEVEKPAEDQERFADFQPPPESFDLAKIDKSVWMELPSDIRSELQHAQLKSGGGGRKMEGTEVTSFVTEVQPYSELLPTRPQPGCSKYPTTVCPISSSKDTVEGFRSEDDDNGSSPDMDELDEEIEEEIGYYRMSLYDAEKDHAGLGVTVVKKMEAVPAHSPPANRTSPLTITVLRDTAGGITALPSLNDVNTAEEIRIVILARIRDSGPSMFDVDSLRSYVLELINAFYFREACDFLDFLWKVVREPKRQDDLYADDWSECFMQIMSKAEKKLYQLCGAAYYVSVD